MRFDWGVTLGLASPGVDGHVDVEKVTRLMAQVAQAGVSNAQLAPLASPAAQNLGQWFAAMRSLEDDSRACSAGFALGRGLAHPSAPDDGIGAALRWATSLRLGPAVYNRLGPIATGGASGRLQGWDDNLCGSALDAIHLARATLPQRQRVLPELQAKHAVSYSLGYALRAGEARGAAELAEDPRKQAARCIALCYRAGMDPASCLAARAGVDGSPTREGIAQALGVLVDRFAGPHALAARIGHGLGRLRGALENRTAPVDPALIGDSLDRAHKGLTELCPTVGLQPLLGSVGWPKVVPALQQNDRGPGLQAVSDLVGKLLLVTDVLEAGCTRPPGMREHVMAGYRASIAANHLCQVNPNEEATREVTGGLRTAHALHLLGVDAVADVVVDAMVRGRFPDGRTWCGDLAWGPPTGWPIQGVEGKLLSCVHLGLELSVIGRTRPDDHGLRPRLNSAVAHASEAGFVGSAAQALGELAFEVKTSGAHGLDLDGKVRDIFEQLPRGTGTPPSAKRGRATRAGAMLGILSRFLERSHGGADLTIWVGSSRARLLEVLGTRWTGAVEAAWLKVRAPLLGVSSAELLSGKRADTARQQLAQLADAVRAVLDPDEKLGFDGGFAVQRMALEGLPRTYEDEVGRATAAIQALAAAQLPADLLAELGAAVEDALSDAHPASRRVVVAADLGDQLDAARERVLSAAGRYEEDARDGAPLLDYEVARDAGVGMRWPADEARGAISNLPNKIALSAHDPEWGRLVTTLVPPHPLVRAMAVDVAQRLPTQDPVLQAAALFEAVRHHCKYVRDPGEFVHPPLLTIAGRGGDCEDLAVVLAALLSASGIPAALVWQPGHMIAAAYLPAVASRCPFPGNKAATELAGFSPMDPTLATPFVTNTTQLNGFWRVDPWDVERPVIQGSLK